MGTRVAGEPARLALAAVIAFPDGGAAARARARAALTAGEVDRAWERAVGEALAERVPGVEEALAATGWRWVAWDDGEFPAALATLADPPLGLFVRGRLPGPQAVALVGSRRATAYGREVAEYLGRELARAGVWVISGMARGVDGAAHRGALASSGFTAAVWGAGPDRIYPAEHATLAAEIAQRGGLLTEYPPGTPPLPQHFPERNRLVAGLARVVVVIEASERSGALITARLALEEGREVMAVPGSVFSRLSAGPNGLLRAGAAPVLAPSDVLDVLGISPPSAAAAEQREELDAFLPAGEAVSVDHLAALTGWPVARVLEALVAAELRGTVVREPDGRYRRHRAHC
jgi:DNA processing protein